MEFAQNLIPGHPEVLIKHIIHNHFLCVIFPAKRPESPADSGCLNRQVAADALEFLIIGHSFCSLPPAKLAPCRKICKKIRVFNVRKHVNFSFFYNLSMFFIICACFS